MGFFEENWFWRGTQSAIFYYVSCSPCIERRHKRRRRNEASRAKKRRDEIIANQPGIVQQPAAFQTNEDWLEEILMGPGPPRGWKRDPIAEKAPTSIDKHKQPSWEVDQNDVSLRSDRPRVRDFAEVQRVATLTSLSTGSRTVSQSQHAIAAEVHGSEVSTDVGRHDNRRISTPSISSSNSNQPEQPTRPSLERRFSTAMDNLRDTLRSTMRAENWNWIRYERDDEILSGLNQRMTEMWNKATTSLGMTERQLDEEASKASTNKEDDHFDYEKYTRHPEINELHPPVVSRLPVTRDEAAWMRLPPPSAAVMEGKIRPQDEATLRWPLSHIGRTPEDWAALHKTSSAEQRRLESGQAESIPELSDSYTEASSSSDEEAWRAKSKRPLAPSSDLSKAAASDSTHMKTGKASQEQQSMWIESSRLAQARVP